ncbi:MAG TPA: Flp family type IVb pilin [Rhizomicrobium sp.]|nr:Flp family type IVb pilin [Rhizomicrobium sp.]
MGPAPRLDRLRDAAGRCAAHCDAARSALKRFAGDEGGATAIEYAMIASIVSIVIFAAVTSIGSSLKTFFQALANFV